MANPQKENGHTEIANELLEALCRADLNGTELSVVLCVIRKTYGYNKKNDWISIGQFEKATGKDRTTVCRTTKSLVAKLLLVAEKPLGKTIYGLNKDYSQWVVAKTPLVAELHTGSGETAQKVVAKLPPTKDNIQKTITKERAFAPPTASEVEEYCQERKNGISGAAFVDYYQMRAWKLKGGVSLKDWRAAIRTWEGRRKEDSPAKKKSTYKVFTKEEAEAL